ncbi:DUF296 domain-containing protein [Salipiger mangrovisoli]|uniref:DUF296 domain-containing protein n=1 Tax=Salipiger mangrovisoli TaxID=2865933 RepID=A0ABR9X5R1_9RHOB|nr:DUF296 domain-containing protein [Salipiger mangrovisoli]MBE9638777.1 DUF296 domain-containing protein [Salipiger mangrovisoli]
MTTRTAIPGSDSRTRLRHPGPEAADRSTARACDAVPAQFLLTSDLDLLAALTSEMDRLAADHAAETAVIDLSGLRLQEVVYVIPAGARDERHAAWYSDTYVSPPAVLECATVTVGRRDGQWFAHCHALWTEPDGTPRMGHLLCDKCLVAENASATGHVLRGALLEVATDPETNFPLFHARDGAELTCATTAALVTVRPHEDLCTALEAVAGELGARDARLIGLGSLIGADFSDAPAMPSPISEVLLAPGAQIAEGRCPALPVICVDPEQDVWRGSLVHGGGPVCVTFELLMLFDRWTDDEGGDHGK